MQRQYPVDAYAATCGDTGPYNKYFCALADLFGDMVRATVLCLMVDALMIFMKFVILVIFVIWMIFMMFLCSAIYVPDSALGSCHG